MFFDVFFSTFLTLDSPQAVRLDIFDLFLAKGFLSMFWEKSNIAWVDQWGDFFLGGGGLQGLIRIKSLLNPRLKEIITTITRSVGH